MENLFNHLVNQTELYLKKNNIKSIILGISGGIDSTVCAVICNAVSKKNSDITLYGVSLPSQTNKEQEISVASLVGRSFCDVFITCSIDRSYETVLDALGLGKLQTRVANGNFKARLRMMYLYNLASINRGIVIDTDNIDENMLGFWTIHGDEGDFNPIGGLWKSEIYKLAEELSDKVADESGKKAILESIKLTPTDGNGVMEGGDMAQIAPGLSYKDVEEILRVIKKYEKNYNLLEFMKFTDLKDDIDPLIEKFGEERVIGVLKRFERSRFKRMHRPFIISMTPDKNGNYIQEKG